MQDNLPHPVPPYAFLRYKENYFFIILAEKSRVFGVIHLNHEPGFDRARYVANLNVRGRLLSYANQTAFPKNFALSRRIGDDNLSLSFIEPEQGFGIVIKAPEVDIDVTFNGRFATFDYSACRTAGNAAPSFQEIMTLGLNLPYNHQQQAMTVSGTVAVDGESISFEGFGYRDHSWVMRNDSIGETHCWCGFNFPSKAFGAKIMSTTHRPGLFAREGYVVDNDGSLPLRSVETREIGMSSDGLPETLIHELEDVFGTRYTIESDIAGRLAHVPLVSQAPNGAASFHIVDNFCRTKILETGEEGIALIEIGRSSRIGGPFS
jgi:hypothetical protein